MKKLIGILTLLALTVSMGFAQASNTVVSYSGSLNSASASCNATNCMSLTIAGPLTTAGIKISGTWVGTFQFEGSFDNGATYTSVSAVPLTGGTLVTSTAANGNWLVNVAGLTNIQTRGSAYTSGTAAVVMTLGPGSIADSATISGALPAGSNIIGKVGIDQTTPGTTNAVQVTNLPSTVDSNNGTTSANTPRVTISSDSTGQIKETNLPATVDTNSGAKSASTIRVVLATDQPQLSSKLLVTPDSVALPANQSINAAQVGGTATDTNSGVKSAGTIRVVIATDQPQLTNKLLVTPDSVALPANQSVNIAQVNGTTAASGSGVVGAGVQRHVLATDVGIPLGSATVGQTSSNGSMAANDTAGIARVFAVAPFGFDGTNNREFVTSSLANEAPSSGAFTIVPGLQMYEKGPRWSVTNTGVASGSQGTASIAAAASKRHVVDCIGFSADSAAAVVAANATINVRDGASGAGTVIWFYAVSFPTASALGLQEIPPQHFCGLNLIGTTNTAMTFEFSAGVTGSIQAVNMSGYDIN